MNAPLSLVLRLVLGALGLAVSFLPRRFELALGGALGSLVLASGLKRANVARENLRRCYPAMADDEREALLRRQFRHLGVLTLELLHLFSPIPGHYRRYIQRIGVLEGLADWKKAHDKGKGVIFVSAHMGNWEVMVGQGALGGIPLTMVTKLLKPAWLHRKIERERLSMGVKGAYEPRTLPIVMRALRSGESVGFVMDQYAGPPIGIPVPFFGVNVGTLAAVSVLVERTGAAVVPVSTVRDEKGVVRVRIEPELDLSSVAHDNARCTARLTAHVETWVRAQPEQWLWTHRRFKNVVWPKELA